MLHPPTPPPTCVAHPQGLGLVFVAVYQKALKLLYVEELLERANRAFSQKFRPNCYQYPDFDATFQRLLKDCEERAEAAKRPSAGGGAAGAVTQANGTATQAGSGRGSGGSSSEEGEEDGGGDSEGAVSAAPAAPPAGSSADVSSAGEHSDSGGEGGGADGAGDEVAQRARLAKLARRAGPGGRAARSRADHHDHHPKKPAAGAAKKGPRAKEARVWDSLGGGGGGKKVDAAALDFTDGAEGAAAGEAAADFNQRSLIDVEEQVDFDSEGEEVRAVLVGLCGARRVVWGSWRWRECCCCWK